jgi:hypothetical protein
MCVHQRAYFLRKLRGWKESIVGGKPRHHGAAAGRFPA